MRWQIDFNSIELLYLVINFLAVKTGHKLVYGFCNSVGHFTNNLKMLGGQMGHQLSQFIKVCDPLLLLSA